jgi:hypothetical protein
MHKKSQVQKIFWEFSRIFTVQHRKLFQDRNIPKSYLTQIRGFSWHKNEIKRIRRSYYSSNNFQDSNKTKRTESKTLGYLPRVLFFRDFYFRALGSLVCSVFPSRLVFPQFCPSPCLKPLQGARTGGIPFSWPLIGAGKWRRCWCPVVDTSPLIQIIMGPTTCPR